MLEVLSRWEEGTYHFEDYVFHPRWTEILRLAAARLRLAHAGRTGRQKATAFVQKILHVADPFPDAQRSLQLVCLILADDVNISDELLQEILDRVVQILSSQDQQELREAFSHLFQEILYSDAKNAFLQKLETCFPSRGIPSCIKITFIS